MENIKPKNSIKKRLAPISYRPPEKLRYEFYARVKNSGLSLNAYITQAVFGRDITNAVIDKKSLALLLSQAARINGYLEEMGQGSTEAQNILTLEECRYELSEIRVAIIKALGKNR